MTVLETERLRLRKLSADSDGDAAFIMRLLNEPSFLRNIGDKGVRDLEGARRYITEGPAASYERHGFGLYLVELKGTGEPAGICGLVRREELDGPDIGYALAPEFWSKGYASEAAASVLEFARETLGLRRLAAVVNPDNLASIRLLERLGFRSQRTVTLSKGGAEVRLFEAEL